MSCTMDMALFLWTSTSDSKVSLSKCIPALEVAGADQRNALLLSASAQAGHDNFKVA